MQNDFRIPLSNLFRLTNDVWDLASNFGNCEQYTVELIVLPDGNSL